jgi:hypothetical protein
MKYKARIKHVHALLYGTCFQYNVKDERKIDLRTPLLVVTMPNACGFLWRADWFGGPSSDVFVFNLMLRYGGWV